jgi:hypothetical protein
MVSVFEQPLGTNYVRQPRSHCMLICISNFSPSRLLLWKRIIKSLYVRYDVLTAVSIKIAVFWILKPCRLVQRHRRFGRTCCPVFFIPEDGGSRMNVAVEKLALRNREVEARRPTNITDVFVVFLRSLRQMLGLNGNLNHGQFLPYPFQLIIR